LQEIGAFFSFLRVPLFLHFFEYSLSAVTVAPSPRSDKFLFGLWPMALKL
jgi:hypothetical protein